MFTTISTYSPAAVDTRFMRATSVAHRWEPGVLHADTGTIAFAVRLLR